MKIAIIGKSGQLAQELMRICPNAVNAEALGRNDIDITDPVKTLATLRPIKPDCIVNASAYTAVDKAESDEENAYLINHKGVENLAIASKTLSCKFIHVSTDFVFGHKSAIGSNGIEPLLPDAPVDPLGVYGASKLAGEKAALEILPKSSLIVRTAWVYSKFGNNFVKTMLNLMASKTELGVIYDQIGTPTWAKGLAEWIWQVSQKSDAVGIHHWTDAGAASWYDFAKAIQSLAIDKGLLQKRIPIKPLSTSEYPTPAARPKYSVLNKTTAEALGEIKAIYWRDQLSSMLDELTGH